MPRQAPSTATPTGTGLFARLAALAWLLLATQAQPQTLANWLSKDSSPPPPASHISDNADLFLRDPDTLLELSKTITQLQSKHGFSLYVVIEPVLITNSTAELAAKLQQSWLPKGGGLVVVFEADSRRIGFGRADSNAADLSQLAGQLSSYEILAVLGAALQGLDTTQPPETIIASLIRSLSSGFTEAFIRRQTPPPAGRSLRMALVAIGGLALLALGTLGLGWLLRRSRSHGAVRRSFPTVEIPERLGAPYGGGAVTSRRFGGSAAPHS
jgi:hypothetical protein